MFDDVWADTKRISWLDVGSGYGEILEAVAELAPPGSRVEGLEPMEPKRTAARERGLMVRAGYLFDVREQFDFVSLVNVFSHIPDFRSFLGDLKKVLPLGHELFIETGNIGDLNPHEVRSELGLPHHLVFAGEQNIRDYLTDAGFTIVRVERRRRDGVIASAKNIIKKALGRNVTLALPYTSRNRTIRIRARRTSEAD